MHITGTWYYAADQTAPTLIVLEADGSYRFVNERGEVSMGTVAGATVDASTWGVTGLVSTDGSRIQWSNGTYWTRVPAGAHSSSSGVLVPAVVAAGVAAAVLL